MPKTAAWSTITNNLTPKLSFQTLLFLLLVATYIFNLKYNSPFDDEAIYIILGKLGMFQWDWSSYAAANWMAGSLYAYPPLAALAYSGGGIVGARFLNVIFGLVAIKAIVQIARYYAVPRYRQTTAVLTLLLFGFSSVSLAVSRLATYDIPAFSLFFISWYYAEKARRHPTHTGQWYFFSAVSLVLSVLTKITIVLYAPFLFLFTLLPVKKLSSSRATRKPNRFYYVRYYLIPLIVLGIIVAVTHLSSLIVYINTHVNAEKVAAVDILQTLQTDAYILIPLWLTATITLLRQQRRTLWLTGTVGAIWIILFHLITHRSSTLDKHIYFTYASITLMAAIGIAPFVKHFDKLRQPFKFALVTLALPFFAFSVHQGYQFGQTWYNTSKITAFLNQVITSKDYVLSEVGQTTMLATYNKNHPLHTTTLDWYNYQGQEGDQAYIRALQDAHFNYLVLHQNESQLTQAQIPLHRLIVQNYDDAYIPVYADPEFIIYQRTYQ